MKLILSALLVLSACSCSQEVPSKPVAAPTAAAAQAADASTPVQRAPDKLDAQHLSVGLGEVDCSSAPVAVATLKWDAAALKVSGVSIFVESPGNEQKLWIDGGASGEATTGKWVFEHSRFIVQDKSSGEVLGTRVLDSIPCRS
jgi:hypothetical protein